MQRLLIMLLLVIYSVSSTGLELYIHYCCGKVAGIDVVPRKIKRCQGADCHFSKNCCDDEVLSFSIKDSHKAASSILMQQRMRQPADAFHVSPVSVAAPSQQISFRVHAPPPLCPFSDLSFICVFRI